jgi:hypothetical protein
MIESRGVCHRLLKRLFHSAFLIERGPRQGEKVDHPDHDFLLTQRVEGAHSTWLPLLAVSMDGGLKTMAIMVTP